MNELIYQVATDKSFREAVEAVEAQTPVHGFRVLYTHDYQTILTEKGFNRGPLKIIEVCGAEIAYKVLQEEGLFSLMMPCRITVYIEEGKTKINTLRPTAMLQMFQKLELEEYAKQAEKILIEIIDSSK